MIGLTCYGNFNKNPETSVGVALAVVIMNFPRPGAVGDFLALPGE